MNTEKEMTEKEMTEFHEYHSKRLMECIKANIDVFKRLANK
jgi:hypothetical protein